ncbi:hypothetical protein YC2023_059882 [Brassica napus]
MPSRTQLSHTGNILSRHKFEPYRGYIAEHLNDEEEVEGIDLHQQRYPWEGSDIDYLYEHIIRCLLLLTVKSLSLQCVRTAKASQLMASGDVTLGAWFIGLGYTKSVVTLKLLPHLTLILVLGRIADCE